MPDPPSHFLDYYVAMGAVYAGLGDVAAAGRVAARCEESARQPDRNPFVAGYSPFHDLVMIALPYAADDLAWRERLAAQSAAGFVRAGAMVSGHAARAAQLPLLLLEGYWREAKEVGQALHTVRGAGEAWWDRITGPVLATIAHARGEAATAWSLVREYHPAGPDTEPGGTYYHAGLTLQRIAAAIALDARDCPTARDWLLAHDRWLAWSGAVLGQAESALAWAAYYHAVGDRVQARDQAERALARATEPRQPLALLVAHRTPRRTCH